MNKTAIVLLNMGGPDNQEAVKPFLFNLFSDKNMIRLPNPFRYLLAKLISSKREEEAKHIYQQMGGGSPILPLTEKQASSLKKILNEADDREYEVFIAMRYWHPFAKETIKKVKEFNPDEVILLPLYPQLSTTTTFSSIDEWKTLSNKEDFVCETKGICCYSTDELFINSHVENIIPYYQQASDFGTPRILFSAHGLPEKIVAAGDPYQWQVEQTAKAVVKSLESRVQSSEKNSATSLDWRVCYQSKVGPMKWLSPSTEDEILKAAKEKTPLVIVPIAFVSEHSETLVELDIQYKELAKENGLEHYFRVPALGDSELFIKSLAGLCKKAIESDRKCISSEGNRICPKKFSGCINTL